MAIGPPKSRSNFNDPFRIVFMGTPALAARILERLIGRADPRFEVVGVVTRPDRPRGRGLATAHSEVAAIASRYELPTLKPARIRTPEFAVELDALKPDLLVVAAYGRILPDSVLDTPRIMPINVHASLLPRHRGAAPIEAAILAGDAMTGVTIMRITRRMDAGPIVLQRSIAMALDETQATLKAKLAELGADALLDAIEMLARGELIETAQDENLATYTKPIQKEDATIDWNASAVQIERMVRAYDPWPIARSNLGAHELLIWRAAVDGRDAHSEVPGAIVTIDPPTVQCGVGLLRLIEVQAPGRKRMAATDFMRGRRIAIGARLGRHDDP